MLRSLITVGVPVSGRTFVRLPGSSLDSDFRVRILVWICSARFSISSFLFPAGLSCDCLAPARVLVSGFRFQFGLTPLASQFLGSDSDRALVGLLGSSPDWGFMSPVSDSGLDLLRSLFNFRFPVSGRSLVQVLLQPRFWFLVPGSRFWFGPAPPPLASRFPVSGFRLGSRAIAQLQPGLRIRVPSSSIWFGLAPLAS